MGLLVGTCILIFFLGGDRLFALCLRMNKCLQFITKLSGVYFQRGFRVCTRQSDFRQDGEMTCLGEVGVAGVRLWMAMGRVFQG